MGTLFERLKSERERLGFTQAQLAEFTGHSRKTQIRYETGERSPDGNYFAEIAKLGADINYLVTGVPTFSDKSRLRLAIEAVEEGLDAFDREATPDVRAGLIFAAYEMLEEQGEKATAEIIRLVKAA